MRLSVPGCCVQRFLVPRPSPNSRKSKSVLAEARLQDTPEGKAVSPVSVGRSVPKLKRGVCAFCSKRRVAGTKSRQAVPCTLFLQRGQIDRRRRYADLGFTTSSRSPLRLRLERRCLLWSLGRAVSRAALGVCARAAAVVCLLLRSCGRERGAVVCSDSKFKKRDGTLLATTQLTGTTRNIAYATTRPTHTPSDSTYSSRHHSFPHQPLRHPSPGNNDHG